MIGTDMMASLYSLLKKGFCPGEDASLVRGTSLRRQIDSRRRAVGFFSFKPFENDGVFQQTAKGIASHTRSDAQIHQPAFASFDFCTDVDYW